MACAPPRVLAARQIIAVVATTGLMAVLLPLAATAPVQLAGGAASGMRDATGERKVAVPVTPEVEEYPVLAGAAVRSRGSSGGPDREKTSLRSEPRPVTGYGVVGITWQGDPTPDAHFEVRTHDAGTWSPWQELHSDAEEPTDAQPTDAQPSDAQPSDAQTSDGTGTAGVPDLHGPDPGSTEAEGARPGTDPVVVGEVDEVQVRVAGAPAEVPEDLTLTVVDPQQTELVDAAEQAAAHDELSTSSGAVELAAAPSKPRIRSRARWGANEKLRDGKPSYGSVRAGFVHHTVNSNGYRRSDVPSILRGIYAYHTQGRGWSDIGYNFLVDRFGRLWEGRYGGMGRAVIGAHTLGYNHLAFAVSAIGNFDVTGAPPRMVRAIGRLMAWKLAHHGVKARGTTTLSGRSFSKISGHRDAGSTACPGRHLYARLGAIRNRAARIQSGGTKPAASRPGFTKRRPLNVSSKLEHRTNLFTGVGDVTGDGRPELVTRSRRTGHAAVRPGRSGYSFAKPVSSLKGKIIRRADIMSGVGNLVGRKGRDLVVRDPRTDKLWAFPGKPGGRWGKKTLLRAKAPRLTSVHGVPDRTGDRRRDLIARTTDRLVLFPGRKGGSLGQPRLLAKGWSGRNLTMAGRDLSGDGKPDILSRNRSTGVVSIHAMRAGGKPGKRLASFRGWGDLHRAQVLGDSASGRLRIVARAGNGTLVDFTSLR